MNAYQRSKTNANPVAKTRQIAPVIVITIREGSAQLTAPIAEAPNCVASGRQIIPLVKAEASG